jgi:hypothetical protein
MLSIINNSKALIVLIFPKKCLSNNLKRQPYLRFVCKKYFMCIAYPCTQAQAKDSAFICMGLSILLCLVAYEKKKSMESDVLRVTAVNSPIYLCSGF